jgi:hypothetical protein
MRIYFCKRVMIRSITATIIMMLATQVSTGQTALSGQINDYTAVSDINYTGNYLVVGDATPYAVDDKAVLIQMNGATINSTNSSSFGDITSYGGAGSYEIVTVCGVSGDTVTLKYTLENTYATTYDVQLVRMPTYSDAQTSSSNVTAPAWDGSTGGVIAVEVTDTLSMNTHFVADHDGFDGADFSNSSFSCSWINVQTDHVYDYSTGRGALKGDGIAAAPSGSDGGRAPLANGGGGANDHNGGGGGGANYGGGGDGGERVPKSTFYCKCTAPGTGGNALTYSNSDNKIFLGGGGGAGHGNNSAGTSGGNGGGIIIIRAGTLVGNSKRIRAKGAGTSTSGGDGAGGGGAGGTILLDVSTYSGNVNVWAYGGNGGKTNNGGGLEQCNGPGGGGGGGVIWVAGSSTPSSILDSLSGGTAGTTTSTSQSNCTLNGSNSASAGSAGAVVTDLSMPESNTSYGGCGVLLPIELLRFEGAFKYEEVFLNWTTGFEANNSHFIVERAAPGEDWTSIGRIAGSGNSTRVVDYQLIDPSPRKGVNYYRLRQVDYNGAEVIAGIVAVKVVATRFEVKAAYPNPVHDHLHLAIESPTDQLATIEIIDLLGRVVLSDQLPLQAGTSALPVDLSSLPANHYLLRVSGEHGVVVERIVKR